MLAINNKVDWFYRQGLPGDLSTDIPLLDKFNRTIVGIPIRDLNNKISDPVLKKNIEEAIAKMTFKVVYKKGEAWVQGTYPSRSPQGHSIVS